MKPAKLYAAVVWIISVLFSPSAYAATNGAWLLHSVHMTSPLQGWALGETSQRIALLKTADGGSHWTEALKVSLSPDNNLDGIDSIGLAFRGTKTVWVAANLVRQTPEGDFRRVAVQIEQTQDGGGHWRQSRIIPSSQWETGWLTLAFPDERHGFLLAKGDTASGSEGKTIYRTSNAGKHWAKISAVSFQPNEDMGKRLLPLNGGPTGIVFQNPRSGWVTFSTNAMPDEYLYQTTDGGYSWRQRLLRLPPKYSGCAASAYPPAFFGKARMDGLLPVYIFYDHVEGFTVYATQDGGAHWHSMSSGSSPEADAQTCFFVDAQHGWVLGNKNRLYATGDSGRHWKLAASKPLFSETAFPIGLDFLNPQRGWALAEETSPDNGDQISRLLTTQDGGQHWTEVYAHTLPDWRERRMLIKRHVHSLRQLIKRKPAK